MNFNVGTIGVVVVAVLILLFLYIRKRNDEKGQEEVKVFLNTLYSDFENIIINYIDKIDIFNLENLALAEQEIVNALIGILWNKAVKALEEYVTDALNKALIKKFLTRENVEQFIKEIFDKSTKVQTVYTSRYNDAILAANKEAILLEAKVAQQNEDIDKNILNEDDQEVEYIDPNSIINAGGEVVEQEINPPHDEELEEVDLKDNSVEIIE